MRVNDAPSTGAAPRVLVIAPVFAPASPIGTMRTLRLVRRMDADGWRATVLTATPGTYLPTMPQDPALLERVPPAVDIRHAPVLRPIERLNKMLRPQRSRPVPSPGTGEAVAVRPRSWYRELYAVVDELTSIPDREIGWVLPAILSSMSIVRSQRPRVIYSTAPPWSAQVAAYAVAKLSGLPWVADFRDPWARAPWRENQPERQRRAAARLESRVVRRADAILFATPANRHEYASHYGPEAARKFFVVPNGCDPDEFAGRSRPADSETFTLVHAGSLYGARTPVPLFEAIASMVSKGLVRRDKFRLRLIGTSTLDRDLDQALSQHNLDDVVQRLPRMPRREIVDAMASASALLVLQPGTTVSIPGKIYEYFALGKPVLALCEEGDTAELVRASGAGVAVTSPDAGAVEDGLVELLRLREHPVVPAHRDLYDGTRFAGEALAVIAAVAGARNGDADQARRVTAGGAAVEKAGE